jgi:hypothetical protein
LLAKYVSNTTPTQYELTVDIHFVALSSSTHSGLANAQNKTLMQPQGGKSISIVSNQKHIEAGLFAMSL